jgi:hypothetical protein
MIRLHLDLKMATSAPQKALKLVNSAPIAHFNICRLLHGSACLPKRHRAPDRFPFDAAV